MTAIDVDSDGDTVIVSIPLASAAFELTPRQAFNVVTELLRHIDRARTYAATKRKEST
ncbi:hypothetical protein ACWD2L_06105 [Streptomyces sp. NPDC002754]